MNKSGVDDETMAALDAASDVFRSLGATVVDVTLPARIRGDAVTQGIVLSEAFAIHQDWLRNRPELYGRVTRERLMMGAFVSGAEYVQALRLRRILTAEVDAVLAGCDAILCSSTAGGAPLLKNVDEGPFRKEHPITALFNATGHPAIVLPSGVGSTGMPLSLSLAGRSFDEARLFRIAAAYERQAGWVTRRPSLPG